MYPSIWILITPSAVFFHGRNTVFFMFAAIGQWHSPEENPVGHGNLRHGCEHAGPKCHLHSVGQETQQITSKVNLERCPKARNNGLYVVIHIGCIYIYIHTYLWYIHIYIDISTMTYKYIYICIYIYGIMTYVCIYIYIHIHK